METDAASPSLPWGALPLERYVLTRWHTSEEPNLEERRRRLAKEFVGIGHLRRAELCDPTIPVSTTEPSPSPEWPDILSPLRTCYQRYFCGVPGLHSYDKERPADFGQIWLRTYYGPESEAAHARLVDILNYEIALEWKENILNDATLYDYGDRWDTLFQVLPEALLPGMLTQEGGFETARDHDAYCRQRQCELLADDQQDDADALTTSLHALWVANYIIVVDKIALRTGNVLVVFFDDCGRVVRQCRIDPRNGTLNGINSAWSDQILDEAPEFQTAEIGQDYQVVAISSLPLSPLYRESQTIQEPCSQAITQT